MEKVNFGKYAEIRNFIAAEGSRFMTLDFYKKDGSLRRINFNPLAAKNHTAGESACDSAKQAVATRAANNPNLLNVWEHNNESPAKFRSINMDSVVRIGCGRKEIKYLDSIRF
jgi:hypothetical protein